MQVENAMADSLLDFVFDFQAHGGQAFCWVQGVPRFGVLEVLRGSCGLFAVLGVHGGRPSVHAYVL